MSLASNICYMTPHKVYNLESKTMYNLLSILLSIKFGRRWRRTDYNIYHLLSHFNIHARGTNKQKFYITLLFSAYNYHLMSSYIIPCLTK